MIKISKICLQQNSIFIKFENYQFFFYKILELFLVLFYNVEKRNVYIHFAWVSVCLFVCLYPINVKIAEIGTTFLWDLT